MKKNQKKLKWSVLGLGNQAEKIALAIKNSNNGILSQALSKDKIRAEEFAKKYGAVRGEKISVSALKKTEAVFITSPNHEHHKHCLLAIKSGRHALCEKPLAMSVAEGLKIRQALSRTPVKFGVGFHLRFHPLIQEAKKIISSPGLFGQLRLVEINWSIGRRGESAMPPLPDYMAWREEKRKSGGGAIMARGVHLFDLLRFLTGREIDEVAAFTDGEGKEVDKTAVGILKIGGAFAHISTSRLLPNALNIITVYGSNGRLILRDVLGSDGGGTLEWTDGDKKNIKKSRKSDLYKNEVEAFADWVKGAKVKVANIADGLASLGVTEAFYKSAGSGRSVLVRRIPL